MDLPQVIDQYVDTIIEICSTVNWKHPKVTYCQYDMETKSFVIRIGARVYTAFVSPDPTPKDDASSDSSFKESADAEKIPQ